MLYNKSMTRTIWDCKAAADFKNVFDCYIAEALLSEGKFFGNKEQTLSRYKVKTIEELAERQKERLHRYQKLEALYYEIELPLAKILWEMEQKGILLDSKQLTKVGEEIDKTVATVENNIIKETGDGININSSVQLGSFLAEKVGIPLGRTKTGKYATNEAELNKFKDQFPIIDHLLSYRELTKLRSTYVESLIQKIDLQNRIHTTYNQVFVNTGRLTSSNPNLQNIPVSSALGLKIKSCFNAPPGCMLVSFDYSQQELRILAHLANEQALIKAFSENQDVHMLTASKLFNVPYNTVSKEQRSIGKTINFGIIYGMSSFGMSQGLHIPQEDAELFIRQFFLSYPNIKIYYDNYLKNAAMQGVVETLLGRRRYVFEDPRHKLIDNSLRRILLNYPVQGSAADLMKKAMVDLQSKVLTKYPHVFLLLQIHDDLVFEVPDDVALPEIVGSIKDILCAVYPLSVPLAVEIKIGKKWGDMRQFTNS